MFKQTLEKFPHNTPLGDFTIQTPSAISRLLAVLTPPTTCREHSSLCLQHSVVHYLTVYRDTVSNSQYQNLLPTSSSCSFLPGTTNLFVFLWHLHIYLAVAFDQMAYLEHHNQSVNQSQQVFSLVWLESPLYLIKLVFTHLILAKS